VIDVLWSARGSGLGAVLAGRGEPVAGVSCAQWSRWLPELCRSEPERGHSGGGNKRAEAALPAESVWNTGQPPLSAGRDADGNSAMEAGHSQRLRPVTLSLAKRIFLTSDCCRTTVHQIVGHVQWRKIFSYRVKGLRPTNVRVQ
jgi:hypothetical protein